MKPLRRQTLYSSQKQLDLYLVNVYFQSHRNSASMQALKICPSHLSSGTWTISSETDGMRHLALRRSSMRALSDRKDSTELTKCLLFKCD